MYFHTISCLSMLKILSCALKNGVGILPEAVLKLHYRLNWPYRILRLDLHKIMDTAGLSDFKTYASVWQPPGSVRNRSLSTLSTSHAFPPIGKGETDYAGQILKSCRQRQSRAPNTRFLARNFETMTRREGWGLDPAEELAVLEKERERICDRTAHEDLGYKLCVLRANLNSKIGCGGRQRRAASTTMRRDASHHEPAASGVDSWCRRWMLTRWNDAKTAKYERRQTGKRTRARAHRRY